MKSNVAYRTALATSVLAGGVWAGAFVHGALPTTTEADVERARTELEQATADYYGQFPGDSCGSAVVRSLAHFTGYVRENYDESFVQDTFATMCPGQNTGNAKTAKVVLHKYNQLDDAQDHLDSVRENRNNDPLKISMAAGAITLGTPVALMLGFGIVYQSIKKPLSLKND